MEDKSTDNLEEYPLRVSCPICGHNYGHVQERNGQAIIYCNQCNRWQYNAPKKERGLSSSSTRTDGIKPSVRYRVGERVGFKCEFCGADADDKPMHIGHLISEKDLRDSGLPPEAYRDEANLAWLCDECNLGMGAKNIDLHAALIFAWRRRLKEGEH